VAGRTYQSLKKFAGLDRTPQLSVKLEQKGRVTPQKANTVMPLQAMLPPVQVNLTIFSIAIVVWFSN